MEIHRKAEFCKQVRLKDEQPRMKTKRAPMKWRRLVGKVREFSINETSMAVKDFAGGGLNDALRPIPSRVTQLTW
jgi:hypothetical protein